MSEGFRINLYGVGRSGTKAVQTWLAYLLARRHGAVWVNYEPLRYKHRKLAPSHYGWRVHRNTPQLLDTAAAPTGEFAAFCHMLAEHPVNVTKFIRGNGRINAIDAVMKPDLSILIVRDLYEVLESVLRLNWSLVADDVEWQRLCAVGRGRVAALDAVLKPGQENKILVNAAHWALHNLHALEHLETTYAIPYKRLDLVEALAKQKGLDTFGTRLSGHAFSGSIHGDDAITEVTPLKDEEQQNPLARLWGRRFGRERSGSLCRAVDPLPEPKEKAVRGQAVRLKVERHALLDDLNAQVQERLAAAVARQGIG
ncbi:MAG: hypothetical protein EPO32_06820 [Anaerolineae bacterium]|nr:MAG: hypothetical protein EPO32_06820 [Anaerolineae bacterium]